MRLNKIIPYVGGFLVTLLPVFIICAIWGDWLFWLKMIISDIIVIGCLIFWEE